MKEKALIVVGLIILLVGLVFVADRYSFFGFSINGVLFGNRVVATVGDSRIYDKDVRHYLSLYPDVSLSEEEKYKLILEELIENSVILQEGEKVGIVSKNTNNSSSVEDYDKQNEDISLMEEYIRNSADRITGAVFTVWFFNNNFYGELGPEGSKQLALQKITSIRSKILNKELSVNEAKIYMQSDTSLAKLDPGYEDNVYLEFDKKRGQRITFDEDFSSYVWGLNPGEISEIRLIKSSENVFKEERDSLYAFAIVSDKQSDAGYSDLEEWYEKKKAEYEIKYY